MLLILNGRQFASLSGFEQEFKWNGATKIFAGNAGNLEPKAGLRRVLWLKLTPSFIPENSFFFPALHCGLAPLREVFYFPSP
jgi:hypothetical protein